MRDEDIVQSSGFTASVMDAITREATAPPPIPFPWKRALPGLGWCLAVGIAFLKTRPVPGYTPVVGALGWIAAGVRMSLLSVALSMRVARH
jgi:hypothetical protein